jgi:hypothetical protein
LNKVTRKWGRIFSLQTRFQRVQLDAGSSLMFALESGLRMLSEQGLILRSGQLQCALHQRFHAMGTENNLHYRGVFRLIVDLCDDPMEYDEI